MTMKFDEKEIQKFIKDVYKIIEKNKNESENFKVREVEKCVERSVQS